MQILPAEDKSFSTLEAFAASVAKPLATDGVPEKMEHEKADSDPTILFVEDEASTREMATMYLESEGYRVVATSNAATAITVWEKFGRKIDLVLTDLMMPGSLNGYQLVQRLRADRPELKAIVTSGYRSDSLFGGETCLEESTSFLAKPYRLKHLLAVVQGCLGREEAA